MVIKVFGIVFGLCFLAIAHQTAVTEVRGINCPLFGTFYGPTVTLENFSCSQNVTIVSTGLSTIDWFLSPNSTVNVTLLFTIDALQTLQIVLIDGKVISGIATNNAVTLNPISIPLTNLLGCENGNSNGVSLLAGSTALIINTSPGVDRCRPSQAQLEFTPPYTTTPQTISMTFNIVLEFCFGINC